MVTVNKNLLDFILSFFRYLTIRTKISVIDQISLNLKQFDEVFFIKTYLFLFYLWNERSMELISKLKKSVIFQFLLTFV